MEGKYYGYYMNIPALSDIFGKIWYRKPVFFFDLPAPGPLLRACSS